MQSCYVFSHEFLESALKEISAKFKNFAVFEVNFSDDDIQKLRRGNDKEPILSLIYRFEKESKGKDFIVVLGCEGFGLLGRTELNLKLAKNLNTPIYEKQNLDELRALNLGSKLLISDDLDEILNSNQNIITPYRFEKNLFERAKAAKQSVILPESDDERVLRAAEILLKGGAVEITILAEPKILAQNAQRLGLNLDAARVIDPKTSELALNFAEQIYEARKHKGVTLEEAKALAREPIYFATMMVQTGLAGAVVSGANTTTADTIRPALQLIKTKPNAKLVSGLFFMVLDEEVLAYADCAITPNPTSEELASIAVTSANSAKAFGLEPKVAMLSYSTAGSGSGIDVDLVREATQKALKLEPNLKIAGPIQYDAAVDISVGAKKLPNSDVAGHANVFIFPNLSCGNICYKAVQRSANALAVGPILQGLKKPVNDLSRGCEVADIVNTVLISAIQAGEKGENQ